MFMVFLSSNWSKIKLFASFTNVANEMYADLKDEELLVMSVDAKIMRKIQQKANNCDQNAVFHSVLHHVLPTACSTQIQTTCPNQSISCRSDSIMLHAKYVKRRLTIVPTTHYSNRSIV